jgi:hypothetical protein
MNETDDRLVGDPVWELFAHPTPGPAQPASRIRRYGPWLFVAGLIALGWFLFPPLAVVTACLAVAARDFRQGRQLARSIPSKAGGTICARFRYAWGAWKLGMTAIVLMVASVAIWPPTKSPPTKSAAEPLEAFVAALLLVMVGFMLSAGWTAMGLRAAYRSGMRVWIGEGVNRAGTLFLGMLLVGYTLGVLGPICFWLSGQFPRASDSHMDPILASMMFFGCLLVGPIILLVILDGISRRVIADRPGKFGPKVPTVRKWNP